jgi:hypothetical protein
VKYLHRQRIEIDVLGSEQAISPAIVEKGPPSFVPDAEDIGVGSSVQIRSHNLVCIDVRKLTTLVDEEITIRVTADDSECVKFHCLIKPCKVDRHIVCAPAATKRFARNIGQRIFGWVTINNLHNVHDPNPTARDPFSFVIGHRMEIPNVDLS